jgi:hypothetical protein
LFCFSADAAKKWREKIGGKKKVFQRRERKLMAAISINCAGQTLRKEGLFRSKQKQM